MTVVKQKKDTNTPKQINTTANDQKKSTSIEILNKVR
jgi:hypothetical protein